MGLPSSAMLAFLAVACAPQSIVPASLPDIAPGRHVRTIESGGLQRRYILRVPKTYQKTNPTPVVLMLHGYTGSADRFERSSGMAEEAESAGWIAVFPDGAGDPKGWNAGFINLTGKKVDDIRFLDEVFDDLEKTVNVDKDRLYMSGHSNGAMMSYRYAAQRGEKLAAIAPVAGILGVTKASMVPSPKGRVSALIIHGKDDPLVGYDASSSAMLMGVPVSEGAEWWAKAMGASLPPDSHKAGSMQTKRWKSSDSHVEVKLITLFGAGHEWPSKAQLGAPTAKLILDFFRDHPRRP